VVVWIRLHDSTLLHGPDVVVLVARAGSALAPAAVKQTFRRVCLGHVYKAGLLQPAILPPHQDLVHKLCEKYKADLEMADTADDVLRIFNKGKIASMCGIEGGHQISGSLAALRMFHKLGVRYMTLTHNGGPGCADPACEPDATFAEAKLGGLTAFGYEVVAEMNREWSLTYRMCIQLLCGLAYQIKEPKLQ